MLRLIPLIPILAVVFGCTGIPEVRDMTRRANDNVAQLKTGLEKFATASDRIEREITDQIAEERHENAGNFAFLAEQEAMLELSEDERRLEFYRQMKALSEKSTLAERTDFDDAAVISQTLFDEVERSKPPKEQLDAVNEKLAELLKRDASMSSRLETLFTYAKAVAEEIRKTEMKASEDSSSGQ